MNTILGYAVTKVSEDAPPEVKPIFLNCSSVVARTEIVQIRSKHTQQGGILGVWCLKVLCIQMVGVATRALRLWDTRNISVQNIAAASLSLRFAPQRNWKFLGICQITTFAIVGSA